MPELPDADSSTQTAAIRADPGDTCHSGSGTFPATAGSRRFLAAAGSEGRHASRLPAAVERSRLFAAAAGRRPADVPAAACGCGGATACLRTLIRSKTAGTQSAHRSPQPRGPPSPTSARTILLAPDIKAVPQPAPGFARAKPVDSGADPDALFDCFGGCRLRSCDRREKHLAGGSDTGFRYPDGPSSRTRTRTRTRHIPSRTHASAAPASARPATGPTADHRPCTGSSRRAGANPSKRGRQGTVKCRTGFSAAESSAERERRPLAYRRWCPHVLRHQPNLP